MTEEIIQDSSTTEIQNISQKSKIYFVAGAVGLIAITVIVGIMIGLGNTSKLEGMLNKRMLEKNETQEVALPEALNLSEINLNENMNAGDLNESLNNTEISTENSTEILEKTESTETPEIKSIPQGPTITPTL